MTTRTYTLTFNNITLDTTNLRMEKRGGKEVKQYFLLDDNFTIKDDEITDVTSFRKAMESEKDCVVESMDGDKTTVKVTLELPPLHKPDPPTLECMSSHLDGAHCGLGDWYLEIEEGIQNALNQGPDHRWTTGWYASKKEIASANISNDQGKLCIQVSVSDDFDTPGMGECIIDHSTDLEKIRETIYEAWDDAEFNRKENQTYVGWSILKDGSWIETYIQQSAEGFYHEFPPGDYYHQWGFQEEYDLPDDVKEAIEDFIQSWDGKSQFEYKGFVVKQWDSPLPNYD